MFSKKMISVFIIVLFLSGSFSTLFGSAQSAKSKNEVVIVHFERFRYLEETLEEDATFFIECIIANKKYQSPSYDSSENGKVIDWILELDLAPCRRVYDFNISLIKSINGNEIICDLSENDSLDAHSVKIFYNLDNGWWTGDDSHGDISGYGRLNGCDDGSIYENEHDVELFFSIWQIDDDGDFIPDFIESNIYDTDPEKDDSDSDPDEDGITSQWEWYFGYDPTVYNDHSSLDDDSDSISNIEEFFTWNFGSDPFRKDIFLEIDCMGESPTGESSIFPEESVEMLHYPFHRRNYVVHANRSDIIPYDEFTDNTELLNYYDTYFLNDNPDNWRRGVFHYGLYIYETTPKGFAFSGDVDPFWGYHSGTNSFIISSSRMERNARYFTQTLPYYYASATMHEMGHNFGFRWGNPFGCDAQLGKFPWQIMYYVYGNYVSIMNYRYTYKVFDYSDGSHGFLDHDDWSALNLSYFEHP